MRLRGGLLKPPHLTAQGGNCPIRCSIACIMATARDDGRDIIRGMGFRQIQLRGIDNVSGAWNLVTTACNVKRLFVRAAAA